MSSRCAVIIVAGRIALACWCDLNIVLYFLLMVHQSEVPTILDLKFYLRCMNTFRIPLISSLPRQFTKKYMPYKSSFLDKTSHRSLIFVKTVSLLINPVICIYRNEIPFGLFLSWETILYFNKMCNTIYWIRSYRFAALKKQNCCPHYLKKSCSFYLKYIDPGGTSL